MFAVAAVASNVSALPVGTILDRYGPRIAALIGGVLVGLGCLTLGLAPRLPFDGYIPGYLFLALGGPFVFMPAFQLSNAFPSHSGLILSLLTGAFDASSAVFLIYRLVYERSHGGFTPQKFFLLYLTVPVMILLAQLFLMPKKSYKTLGELVREAQEHVDDEADHLENHADDDDDDDAHEQHRHDEVVVSEVTQLLGMKGAAHQTEEEEKKREISGVWGAMHGYSARQQIASAYFVLVTLFTIVQMTRINYFVATIRTQYAHLLDDYDAAVRINSVFDVALPLGGVIAVPFIGLVLDNTSTPFVLALLVAFATVIGILGVLPFLWAAYINVCLFVVYRPFFYTALS